jgi:hypothetical protein
MRFFSYLLCVIPILSSCNDDSSPALSSEPLIEFSTLEFIDPEDNAKPDTLKLSILFKDGDGSKDLGISYIERDSPFHLLDFFLYDKNHLIKISPKTEIDTADVSPYSGQLVTFSMKDELDLPNTTTFCPLDAHNSYVIGYVRSQSPEIFGDNKTISEWKNYFVLADTFYVKRNESFYNIYVDFLAQKPDGSFELFDWEGQYCVSMNGRFPFVEDPIPGESYKSGPFTLTYNPGKASGSIVYKLMSTGFKYAFSGRKIKLRVNIKDRSLHTSNIIETPLIQF